MPLRETTPTRPSRWIWPGIIPILLLPGEITPGQFGPTSLVFPVLRKLYKFNCRIQGVDTPELRTRDKKEKAYGILVRDKVRERILNKVVQIECGDFDKYGRLLIDIKDPLVEKEKISGWLIKNNYAFEYDGGTKKDWGEYLKKNKL